MKYWIGAILLPFALYMIATAYQRWQRVARAHAALPPGAEMTGDDNTNPFSLAGIGEMVLPIVLAALVFSALTCVAIYVMVDGGRVMTLFDLGAVLLTIAAYGLDFTTKVKCRMPKTAPSDQNSTGPDGGTAKTTAGPGADQMRQPYTPENANKSYFRQQDRLTVMTPRRLEQSL